MNTTPEPQRPVRRFAERTLLLISLLWSRWELRHFARSLQERWRGQS